MRQLQELLSLRQDSGQGPHSYLLSLRSSRVIVTEDKVRHRLGHTLQSYFISAISGQSSEKSVTATVTGILKLFIYLFTRNHKFECVIVVLKVVSKVVF